MLSYYAFCFAVLLLDKMQQSFGVRCVLLCLSFSIDIFTSSAVLKLVKKEILFQLPGPEVDRQQEMNLIYDHFFTASLHKSVHAIKT